MNIERMNQLADAIELSADPATNPIPGLGFNMAGFGLGSISTSVDPECGTSACIGGWACFLFGEPDRTPGEYYAQELLDINDNQVSKLFYNGLHKCDEGYLTGPEGAETIHCTRKQAVAGIRRMVAEEGNL